MTKYLENQDNVTELDMRKQHLGKNMTPSKLFLLYIWSALIFFFYTTLCALSLFSSRLKKQLSGRAISSRELKKIEKKRGLKKKAIIFYVSSAGEYEQAKPLMDKLCEDSDVYIQIIFFSYSGRVFAEKRGESIPYLLAPIDTYSQWMRLFRAVRPDHVVVVRHELWPAFLMLASSFCPVYIVNASRSEANGKSFLNRRIKQFLLKYVQKIFLVSEEDAVFFKEKLSQQQAKLIITGDTKFDRVKDRLLSKGKEIELYREKINQFFLPKKRLIVGSAWDEDARVAVRAYVEIKEKYHDWQLVIAPHDLSKERLDHMIKEAEKVGLSVIRFSEMEKDRDQDCDLLIVDEMGILAELYGLSELAMVGGALHYQVHNVVEPAAFGLNFCHGPLYKNSQEAVGFVDEGLATVVCDSKDLVEWWSQQVESQVWVNNAVLAHISKHLSATDKILKQISLD